MTTTNWPEQPELESVKTYKVVLVEVNGEKHLRFGDAHKKFHGELLKEILKQQNIPYKEKKFSRGIMLPEPKGEKYTPIAMGRARLYFHDNTAIFGSQSADYGLPIRKEHVEHIKSLTPTWTIKHKQ